MNLEEKINLALSSLVERIGIDYTKDEFYEALINYIPKKDKDISLEDLNFSVSTYHVLKRYGINNLEDLKKLKEEDFWRIRNLSRKNYIEIKDKLNKKD